MSRTVQEEADLSSPGSILVIDDEPHMLRYMRTLLEVDSYRVETLSSGLAALDRLQKEPLPDLVLLDVVMQDLDGFQTLDRLHEMRTNLKLVRLCCALTPRC